MKLSNETLQKETAIALAQEMWNALPLWRRHILARWIVGKTELDLFMYLFSRWDGKRYTLLETRREQGDDALPQGYAFALREILQKLIEVRQSHPF